MQMWQQAEGKTDDIKDEWKYLSGNLVRNEDVDYLDNESGDKKTSNNE